MPITRGHLMPANFELSSERESGYYTPQGSDSLTYYLPVLAPLCCISVQIFCTLQHRECTIFDLADTTFALLLTVLYD